MKPEIKPISNNLVGPDRMRVAYVGPVALPNGGAAARRMLGIAATLRGAGYEVLFGSGQMSSDKAPEVGDFGGIPVHSLNERLYETYPTWIKHLFYIMMGRKTRAWLDSLDPKPHIVILYSGYLPYFLNLSGWCRRRGVPLIFDAVEWYDKESMPGGIFGLYRWNFEIAMRWNAVKNGRIIAISSYLERYFLNRGCRTIRIPPTLDVESLPAPELLHHSDGMHLVYSGVPCRKDCLNEILEAVLNLRKEGLPIRITVAGPSLSEAQSYPAICALGSVELPAGIKFIGLVSHAESMELVRRADFTVLMRRMDREAAAGFPTKVVESLALGTPVITNLTSDLGNYLQDGVNAMVFSEHSVEALATTIRKAFNLSANQHQAMRLAAYQCARDNFDYRNYEVELSSFVRTCWDSTQHSWRG